MDLKIIKHRYTACHLGYDHGSNGLERKSQQYCLAIYGAPCKIRQLQAQSTSWVGNSRNIKNKILFNQRIDHPFFLLCGNETAARFGRFEELVTGVMAMRKSS